MVSRPERAPAGQHLVQHAAERPDVRAPVHRLAARLLGAHVRRRAEDHSDAWAVTVGEWVRSDDVESPPEVLREPEVQHLHGAVG